MSGEDKRYDATPARRRRAIRDGNAARSAELSGALAFGASIVATMLAVPLAVAAATRALAAAASGLRPDDVAAATAVLALAALAPLCAAAVIGTAASVAQAGGLHVSGLHIDVKKLDALAGLRRMAGADAAVAAARAVPAFVAALAATLPDLTRAVRGAVVLGSPAAAASFVAGAALRAWLAALGVGLVFAVADYAAARRRWLRGLRMSADELKRETKENEGDPHARARRKSAHRTLVRGAVSRTREASFVVVNPEHVAVALRYAPPAVPVPQILVRALDDAALRVKAIAREHGIPLIEDVALARLLYAAGAPGRAIPPEAYVAVAQIVASLVREGVLACEAG